MFRFTSIAIFAYFANRYNVKTQKGLWDISVARYVWSIIWRTLFTGHALAFPLIAVVCLFSWNTMYGYVEDIFWTTSHWWMVVALIYNLPFMQNHIRRLFLRVYLKKHNPDIDAHVRTVKPKLGFGTPYEFDPVREVSPDDLQLFYDKGFNKWYHRIEDLTCVSCVLIDMAIFSSRFAFHLDHVTF
jgi:hypothetical protein